MESIWQNNVAELCGELAGPPRFSHYVRGEEYYVFPLETKRLSGAVDTVNVTASRTLLESVPAEEGERIRVAGEVRSFNNKSGVGSKLVITVLAMKMSVTNEPDMNRVMLRGTLCKPPNPRRTPMGREICDLMLAVNRRYGRSDYLPCIAWGAGAAMASMWDVGTETGVDGRLQSRRYIKLVDGENVERTAFEVSVNSFFEV